MYLKFDCGYEDENKAITAFEHVCAVIALYETNVFVLCFSPLNSGDRRSQLLDLH